MNQRLAHAIGRTRLYQLYNRRFGKYDSRSVEFFIHEYSRTHDDIFFIQVGGNDGITWDPFHFFIRRDNWQGIVIEPQREVFETQLRATYGHVEGIQLMNVAVDRVDGVKPLYKYSFTSSRWATGAASLDREMLIAAFRGDYVQGNIQRERLTVLDDPNEYLTSELVTCVSFETILRGANRERIDFLLTDVEGHDVEILDSFPLDRVRPANIVFELSRRDEPSYFAFLNKLASYGYDVFIGRSDAIALRRDV